MLQRLNGPEACLRKALRAAEDAGLDADDLKVGVGSSGQLKQWQVDVVRSSRIKLEEFLLVLGAWQSSTTIKVSFKSVEMKLLNVWPCIAPGLRRLQNLNFKNLKRRKLLKMRQILNVRKRINPGKLPSDPERHKGVQNHSKFNFSRRKTPGVDIMFCSAP